MIGSSYLATVILESISETAPQNGYFYPLKLWGKMLAVGRYADFFLLGGKYISLLKLMIKKLLQSVQINYNIGNFTCYFWFTSREFKFFKCFSFFFPSKIFCMQIPKTLKYYGVNL